MKFEEFGLSQELFEAIKALGFTNPTQIQDRCIPLVINGRDVIGESATGSGKTLAFGCGIIDNVVPGQGLQSLILTPTRELAEQIKESIRILSKHKPLKIIPVYGGVSIDRQIHELQTADVVIATPGRLLDHMDRRTVKTSRVKLLVLDEADRMFDMGFIDDVEKIIRNCPKERQTLFFSATITQRVKNLAHRYMANPTIVMAERMVDPAKLKQVYHNVDRNMKLSLLVHLLKKERSGLVMIFCNARRTTDFVAKNLKANNIRAISTHGGLSQNKRNNSIDMFNDAKIGVLVCTDVAARGLHIENVSHVYNYDIPKDAKDYVHRIGRTARAGEEGIVVNLLSDNDYENFARVQGEYRSFKIQRMEKFHIEKIHSTAYAHERGHGPGRRFSNNRRFSSDKRPFSGGSRRPFGRRQSSRGFGRRPNRGNFRS